MIYIGIDPGVRECGLAVEFRGHRYAALVRSSAPRLVDRARDMAAQAAGLFDSEDEFPTTAHVCIEGQQFYGTARSKGDPNDLIALALVAGTMLGALSAVLTLIYPSLPLPRQWKGSVPKGVHHDRLRRDYPEWIAPVQTDTPKSMQHHVWDAVGLLEYQRKGITK